MKKILSLLFVMLFVVSGCSNNKNEEQPDDNNGSTNSVVCKRADDLHTETCNYSSSNAPTWHCLGAGYATGDTIVYGTTGTKGELSSGDAFDCDVNGDGIYNPATERFYYMSDYYNTSTNSFDEEVAVLIYYSNTFNGEVNNTLESEYDATREAWHGPRSAMFHLPTTKQWSNIKLVNSVRTIRNNENTTTLDDFPKSNAGEPTNKIYDLPSAYSYEGYAARLLTYQELVKACDLTIDELTNVRSLDVCEYLLENTDHANKGVISSYWLETPVSDGNYVGEITGINASFAFTSLRTNGVRPVIEIPKNNMEY